MTSSVNGLGRRLFSDIDRALVLASLAERLRTAGLRVPLTATVRATEALGTVGPVSVDDLYWLARVAFVTSQAELGIFDRVFDAVFDTDHRLRDKDRGQRRAPAQQGPNPDDRHHRIRAQVDGDVVEGGGLPWATLPRAALDGIDDGLDDGHRLALPELAPTVDPGLADRAFDLLDPQELARAGELIEASLSNWPQRRSRRRSTAAHGDRPHLRAALRRALQTGGEPLVMPRSKAKLRPRPVTILVDVSGSMEPFARAYLHVSRALATMAHAEVFAFATDLTRITASLRLRSPLEAIEQASDEVGDRFGGTRLATSLARLVRHRSWPDLVRGAVVVIVSDGWDTDRPEDLVRHLDRLRRLAASIIWVNPRLAADDYQPLVGAMAAALPYCDAFLPGNTLAAMDEVITAITQTTTTTLPGRVRLST
ncbi:MAG: VWA domain-containing protein [Actinomycetia bacterium]|nr:VWA domain-containing protein [Actinomycetes bacterium]